MKPNVSNGRANVLEEDGDLAALVPEDDGDLARMSSVAGVAEVPAGRWDAREASDRVRDGYGMLILDGLLVRRVGGDGRFGAELLSAGDLLRPLEFDGESAIGFQTSWRVLTRTRLALLDVAWSERMGRFPRVGPALAGRALLRSRRLAAMMAIAQHPRLEERLWMLFWELAYRHGRVRTDGVHVDLPLTHELLSHLAAARRPSVTGSLARLSEQGRLRREGRGWVLCGAPPSAR
jgi:CRP/FNR family cyclic AMP-dependent transcriptional regulator